MDSDKHNNQGMEGNRVQQLTLAKESFDLFDQRRSGFISVGQLKACLLNLGVKQQSKKLLEIVQYYQKEKKLVQLDFQGFRQMLALAKHSPRELFQAYDKTNKGFIDLNDLERLGEQLKLRYSHWQHQLILRHLDSDCDGKLTWDDFQRILRL